MYAVLFVNIPQIVAAFVILLMYWKNETICDDDHRLKWRLWSSCSAIRMAVYCGLIIIMFKWKQYFDDHPRQLLQITSLRNIVDAMGLVWFIIGNLWIFGDDNGKNF